MSKSYFFFGDVYSPPGIPIEDACATYLGIPIVVDNEIPASKGGYLFSRDPRLVDIELLEDQDGLSVRADFVPGDDDDISALDPLRARRPAGADHHLDVDPPRDGRRDRPGP